MKIFPIYLFTGDDDYLKREAAEKLKKALLGEKMSEALNFNTYEAGKCDIREVMDTLKSAPFMSAKRLVLFKVVEAASREEQNAVLSYAKNPSKSSCLILECSKKEFKGRYYTEISKFAREISFILPKGKRITSWIQREAMAKGGTIRNDAALLLKELKEDDIESLRQEIDKLITYAGNRGSISREDVNNLVGISVSRNVFEFVDALMRKNAKEALAITKEMFRTKKSIPKILGMVGWQFRRIKKAKELVNKGASSEKTGRKCNVPSFYIERFIKEIKSFTDKEIDRNIGHLLDTDYRIKKGYLKAQTALELLVITICL